MRACLCTKLSHVEVHVLVEEDVLYEDFYAPKVFAFGYSTLLSGSPNVVVARYEYLSVKL